jgi:hypothetical protein
MPRRTVTLIVKPSCFAVLIVGLVHENFFDPSMSTE